MKYSYTKHRIETLVKELNLLNPNTVFKFIDDNTIVTNLSGKNLKNIKLPLYVNFLPGNDKTCNFGYIFISYHSKKVKITVDVINNCCEKVA